MRKYVCKQCGNELPEEQFNLGTGKRSPSKCKTCLKQNRAKDQATRYRKNGGYSSIKSRMNAWRNNNPHKHLLSKTRNSAKKRGIAFELDLEDIQIPKFCPVLNIKLTTDQHGKRGDLTGMHAFDSPSVDRIDNTRGYVKGNIVVVSARANMLKKDATTEELVALARFYSSIEKEIHAPV